MGLGPDPRDPSGARAGGAHARRHRRNRAERAVRRPGAGVVRRARRRSRRRAPQPLRRRDRVRPSARGNRRPADRAARPPPRRDGRALRPHGALRRDGHGRRAPLGALRWREVETRFHLRPADDADRPRRPPHRRQRRRLARRRRPSVRARSPRSSSCCRQLEEGDWQGLVLTGKPLVFAAGADLDAFPRCRRPRWRARRRASGTRRSAACGRCRTRPSRPSTAPASAAASRSPSTATTGSSPPTVRHIGFPEVGLGHRPGLGRHPARAPPARCAHGGRADRREPPEAEPPGRRCPRARGRARRRSARPGRVRRRRARLARRTGRVRDAGARAGRPERCRGGVPQGAVPGRRRVHGAAPAPYRALDLDRGRRDLDRRGGLQTGGGCARRSPPRPAGAGVGLRVRSRRAAGEARDRHPRGRRRAGCSASASSEPG